VTFGAVAKRANVSKSGVVAHIANVDKLKAAIIARAMELWRRVCFLPQENSSAVAELTRYMSRWISWTSQAGLPGGCPITSAMFEYAHEGSPVRLAVGIAEACWRKTLVDLIEEAIAGSEVSKNIDASQMAWNLFGVYLNHQVSSRFLRAPDADRKARNRGSANRICQATKRIPKAHALTPARIEPAGHPDSRGRDVQ